MTKSPPLREAFALGSVIVPASDGMLERLGHNVASLGLRALGVVTETRPHKCLVQFPELGLSLWLPKDEIADVGAQAASGVEAFKKLLPNFGVALPGDLPVVWWVRELSHRLPVTHWLGFERGPLAEIWADDPAALRSYFAGPSDTRAIYVGLGIEELKLNDWAAIEKLLGERLLFARFLPAGMHKLEVALYLRDVSMNSDG